MHAAGWVALAAVVSLALMLPAFGAWRWRRATQALLARIAAPSQEAPSPPRAFDQAMLADLPAPVQRYLGLVLTPGQPIIAAAAVRHEGEFDMGRARPDWKPFRSRQRVVTRPPGFVWDAEIAMLPGIPVRVHDAYVAGEGILDASVLGLVPIVSERGGGLARGELMRFLAETPWYPTMLLPGQGVRWRAIDAQSARASLREGAIEVELTFHFGADGLVESVHADARDRKVGARNVPTPWHGRFWSYAERDGIRVPLEGEVAWELPEGPRPYWRGRLGAIRYESAS